MKNLAILIGIFVLQSCESRGSVEEEITELMQNYVSAINARDYARIGGFWHERGELISLAGGIFRGPREIQGMYEKGLPRAYVGATFHYFVHYVREITSDVAVVDGVWKVTGGGPAGYPACGIFLYTLSYREGRWGIEVAEASVPRRGHTREHGRRSSWTEICDSEATD